jgi:surface antigen
LLPLLVFPAKAEAEVNLVEEYVYVAEDSPVLEPNLEITASLYQDWQKAQAEAKKPRSVAKTASKGVSTGYDVCSCVSYMRWRTGINVGSIGNARNHPVNSQTPKVGAIIVTYESARGHVGVVGSWDENYVYLESEANYSRCSLTKGRAIPIHSKVIKGYYVQ